MRPHTDRSRLDRRLLLALALSSLAACVNTPSKGAGTAAFPPPFTAEEIQAANPPGTTLVFLVEQPDNPPLRRTMSFLADDGEQATIESSQVDATTGEEVSETSTREHPWTELRDHAAFPADSTERRMGTAVVPAGTFESWIYLVFVEDESTGARQKQRFYFATDHPGPPVLFEVEDQTGTTYRMALLERRGP